MSTIEQLLANGEIVGHRSRATAGLYVAQLKTKLGLPETDTSIDDQLKDFIVEAVLGAGWYARKYQDAASRTNAYIWINVGVVLAIPIGLILLGSAANKLGTNIISSQVAGVLTGILGLQKTLSAWYSNQQRYAAWYKAGADLKTIYYGFIGRWAAKGATMQGALLADCQTQTIAARAIIDAEQEDFYQRLAAPSFDILDMLTASGGAVSSFVANLLPGALTQVSVIGRNALTAPAGAPDGPVNLGAPDISTTPTQPGVVLRAVGETKPNDNPYTIVIVANPALQTYSKKLAADPIMADPSLFEQVVENTIAALFGDLPGQTEKFLAPFRERMRIVSIFDPAAGVKWSNTLVAEVDGLLLVPLWQRIPDFLSHYTLGGKKLVPDVVFAVTSSAQFTRSGSWPATDDPNGGGQPFAMDNRRYMHAYRNTVAGMTALHSAAIPITALHEFSHAASSWENGFVFDLYNDIDSGHVDVMLPNKRWGRPVPPDFRTYAGVTYKSDLVFAYPADWTSYHCERVDPAYPALMDDFIHVASGGSEACRHDEITVHFLADRIQAIMSRP